MSVSRPWSLSSEREYRALPLRAHQVLDDIPLHDVWRVELPDQGQARTMLDVRAAVDGAGPSLRTGAPVRALFRLRWWLGRVLRWDAERVESGPYSLITRLDRSDRDQSLVPPGTRDGPFTVMYVHQAEAVSEIRNATVHGFVVWALRPALGGHHLYLAVHVLPVGRWTRPYMMLIDPFRRWLVYPAMLRGVHQAWLAHGANAKPAVAE